ncbi:MAG: metallophosphoesterase [Pseudohongiellaceae bacterium]
MKTSSLSIALGSDLHLSPRDEERRRRALAFPDDADVIILAGDITEGVRAAIVALDLADEYPAAHIVWVAGNHEFYYATIDEQIRRFREACADHDRVHFLENDSVEIAGVTFLGCTLWSDFSIMGEPHVAMTLAERMIADFVCIKAAGGFTFTPRDAAARFLESFAYLEEQLDICDPARTVVVTHFPPGLATHNPDFPLDPIAAYFQANVSLLMDIYQPAVWVYGHNHYSSDQLLGSTRVVSNQFGYPSEHGRIPPYDPMKLILLDGGDGGTTRDYRE